MQPSGLQDSLTISSVTQLPLRKEEVQLVLALRGQLTTEREMWLLSVVQIRNPDFLWLAFFILGFEPGAFLA